MERGAQKRARPDASNVEWGVQEQAVAGQFDSYQETVLEGEGESENEGALPASTGSVPYLACKLIDTVDRSNDAMANV